MAEKQYHFANGVKYDDHVSSTSAADSFAAAYSLNASNFTPFPMPYYNPGIFFNQNYQPTLQNFAGYPFWHPFASTHTADYLFNITALQNMQAMAAANHCGESFYDVLNKISQTHSCGGGVDEKDFVPKFCANGLTPQISCSPAQTPLCQTAETTSNRPSSSRTYVSTPFANQLSSSSSPSTTGSPHSNLVTLAEVASSLTPEVFSKSTTIKRNKTPSSVDFGEVNKNVKNGRKRVTKLDNNCEIKVPKIEMIEEQKEEYHIAAINQTVAENSRNQLGNMNNADQASFKQHWDQTNRNNIISTLNANNLKLDQNLLNASAMAWAALTEQLLAAAERREMIMNERTPKEDSKEKIKLTNEVDCPSKMAANKTNATTKPKRPYRRRNALIQQIPNADVPSANVSSVENAGHDHMDETINEIIGFVCSPEARQKVKRQRKNVPSSCINNIADVSTTTLSAQMDDIFSNEALDLTIKKQSLFDLSSTTKLSKGYQNFVSMPDKEKYESLPHCGLGKSKECKTGIRKRRTAETESVRVPLNKGWRRQTCIRTISASGIRGDVIYYAPCGRPLASCGEVLRYLKKLADVELNREHFSFSSKVLVGEFLEIKPTGNKNLSEDEIRNIILSMQRPKNATTGVQAGSKNSRNKPADDCDSTFSSLQNDLETKSILDVSVLSTNADSFIDSLPSSSNFDQLMDEIDKEVCSCVTDLVNTVSEESFQITTNGSCEHSNDGSLCSDCRSLFYNRNYALNGVQIKRLEPFFNSTDVNSNNFMSSSYEDEDASKYVDVARNQSSDTAVSLLKMNEI